MPRPNSRRRRSAKMSAAGRNAWINTSGVRNGVPSNTVVRRLTLTTASAIGSGLGVAVTSASAVNAAEWSSFAARYTMARCLSVKVTFLPANTASYFCVVASDRSGALGGPASAAQAFGLQSARVLNLDTTMPRLPTYEVKATELEDQLFQSTASFATNTFSALIFNPNGAGIKYYVEWMVEFRSAD